jgi:hypothetical protein
MKKFLPFIIGALVLIAGAGAFVSLKKDKEPASNNAVVDQEPKNNKASSQIGKACDVLNLDIAKKVLGDNVDAASTNGDKPTESDDLVVTNCNYSVSGATLGENKTASLLVRAPKTSRGIDSNKQAFGSLKPAAAQDVDGYGEMAFWNPDFGQFNVLKDDTWYIVSTGSLKPAERSPEDAKALAATLGLADGL